MLVLPHLLLTRPDPRPLVPFALGSTKPTPSANPALEQQFFGISRDRMMLYTPPGFTRQIDLKP